MHRFYVRIGSMAEVHAASSLAPVPRGRRVIVRTPRGIELGQVTGLCRASSDQPPAVRVLRPTTEEDELLIRRLEQHKRDAIEACRTALSESGSAATLLDIDQVFDGTTLIMHFLGPVDQIADSVTKSVAAKYESIVRSGQFAKLLQEGCGPDCGTESGGGCGDGCSSCAVACGKR